MRNIYYRNRVSDNISLKLVKFIVAGYCSTRPVILVVRPLHTTNTLSANFLDTDVAPLFKLISSEPSKATF